MNLKPDAPILRPARPLRLASIAGCFAGAAMMAPTAASAFFGKTASYFSEFEALAVLAMFASTAAVGALAAVAEARLDKRRGLPAWPSAAAIVAGFAIGAAALYWIFGNPWA